MIINVTESMARLEEIKNNANEINQKLQEIEQIFQELEAPMSKIENKHPAQKCEKG